MGIRFTVTVKREGRSQEELNQLPFATSLALNNTAKAYVEREKGDLTKRFTIRRNWVAKGFRIKPSSKVNLETVITHKDEFMGLQEHGGTKTPRSGGARDVAVPTGARPTPQSITTPSKWPGKLKRAFYVEQPDRVLLFQRFGPRKRKAKKGKRFSLSARSLVSRSSERDPHLRLMYVLKPAVRVPPRWGFETRAQAFVDKEMQSQFEAALRRALSTAL